MSRIVMICALILLCLFVVYVINDNAARPKSATENTALNLPSTNPSPSQAQALNLTPSPTSSLSSDLSSETSKTDNLSNTMTIVIKTERGNIELALYPKDAPNTVANFINKARSGFYNNLIFHRVEDWVIQGGDPLGNGTGGGNMPTELNNKPFVVGSLGIARGQDINISNDAQFFITKKDSQFLNGKYTNFGMVKSGMDVVSKIEINDKILKITLQ